MFINIYDLCKTPEICNKVVEETPTMLKLVYNHFNTLNLKPVKSTLICLFRFNTYFYFLFYFCHWCKFKKAKNELN